ncbi:MAG: chemoreceptor glutamine deamidase CheD [Gammaproteobacteria bacterium]|nr:chemoreceptor glutamine deamidase CheD [Gammaproteobacteria bacterium]
MVRLIRQQGLPTPPRALRGFAEINRFWDRQRECYAAKILPGEYYVTTNDEIIVTVLGSCVSACIRDPIMRIGGMNHFMLPASKQEYKVLRATSDNEATRYGNFAMEKLINDILKNGGRREHLEIKLFGGGKVIKHMTEADIGNRNIAFVQDYLQTEGFKVVAEDLGDIYPRKVVYYPMTGRVQVKKLRSMHNDTILQRESGYQKQLEQQPVAGDIELFD